MVVLVLKDLLVLRVMLGSEATRDLLANQVNKEGRGIQEPLD